MSTLETVLRSMAAAQLLFMACLLILRARQDRALCYAVPLPVGLATFMLTSAPLPAGTLGTPGLFLTLVCVANPAWFWIFSKAWFDDGFRPGAREAAAVAAMMTVGWMHEGGGPPPPLLDVAFKAAIIGFVTAAVVNVVRGRRSDLDERRRGARVLFAAGVLAYAIVCTVLQIVYAGRLPSLVVEVNVAFLLLIAFGLSAWLATASWHGMSSLAIAAQPAAAAAPAARSARAQPPQAVAVDLALVERIRSAMESERLYRREALTIAVLAKALGSHEYRVRRAINQGLGYRNFNEFLHRYRLDEASARLRTQRHLPILTIALDVGFGSIGPFNRAFRARFGCTPTAYRGAEVERAGDSTSQDAVAT